MRTEGEKVLDSEPSNASVAAGHMGVVKDRPEFDCRCECGCGCGYECGLGEEGDMSFFP